jgi:hypothetical protein
VLSATHGLPNGAEAEQVRFARLIEAGFCGVVNSLVHSDAQTEMSVIHMRHFIETASHTTRAAYARTEDLPCLQWT